MILVFPRKTKWTPAGELCFFGNPPLALPEQQPVRISVVFSWDIKIAEKLKKSWSAYYDDVQIGGPAFGDPGGEFDPGVFIKEGVTITSRGCVRKCQWCFVPRREGKIRELEIKGGWIVQDNNILACSRRHIEKVFEMLSEQNKAVIFSGGLDIRLLKAWHIPLFRSIKIKELWFACDTDNMVSKLNKVLSMFDWLPASKRRCYTMIGFDGDCLYDAEARLETVYQMGFFPFCQLYQGEVKKTYSKPWRKLHRKWSRPAIYNSKSKPEDKSPTLW